MRARTAAGSSDTAVPNTPTSPDDGVVSPKRIRIRVVLPAPFAPTRPVTPDGISDVNAVESDDVSERLPEIAR